MEKPLDRRVRKTCKAIRSAVMRLAVTKPVSQIKVSDVCELADINRSTFYLHYYDVFNVVEDIEARILKTCERLIDDVGLENFRNDPLPILKILTNELNRRPDFCAYLIKSTSTFMEKVKDALKTRFIAEYRNRHEVKDFTKLNYTITFIISGTISVYTQWLTENQPIPVDKMCQYINEQIAYGVAKIR